MTELIPDWKMALLEELEAEIKPVLRAFLLIPSDRYETGISINEPGDLSVKFLNATGWAEVVVKTQIKARAPTGRIIVRNQIGDSQWAGWHARFPDEVAITILKLAIDCQMNKVKRARKERDARDEG